MRSIFGFSRLRGLFYAVLVMLAAISTAMAEPVLHDGITYKSGLKLDVYTPENAGRGGLFGGRKKGVILYAHGGGWVKGSRKKVYTMHKWLTANDYILVVPDYRKVPATSIDGQVDDVADAIEWTRRNIGRYGGDGKRIVIMGHSAGAHLVAMIGAKRRASVRGIIPNDVQAYDMIAYGGMRGSLGYPYLNAFGLELNDWVRWSPVTYARQGNGYPPHLFLHSGSNGERRRALTRGYAMELKSRGTSVQVFDGGRYTHGSIARLLGTPGDEATRSVERFLAGVLR